MLGEIGIWVWGGVTALLGLVVGYVVLFSSKNTLYDRVKDLSGALAGVIAASALAWSVFFQASTAKNDQTKQMDALLQRTEAVVRRLEKVVPPADVRPPASP